MGGSELEGGGRAAVAGSKAGCGRSYLCSSSLLRLPTLDCDAHEPSPIAVVNVQWQTRRANAARGAREPMRVNSGRGVRSQVQRERRARGSQCRHGLSSASSSSSPVDALIMPWARLDVGRSDQNAFLTSDASTVHTPASSLSSSPTQALYAPSTRIHSLLFVSAAGLSTEREQ